jgi:hypothetical protein
LVLVRSFWWAQVHLLHWVPEPDTLARKMVWPNGVLSALAPDVFGPLHRRALIAGGLLVA